jgi:hypothetical protein
VNDMGRYTDHAGRRWLITSREHAGQILVSFTCYRATGRGKALDQTAAWGPEGWDISRWFPVSPRPVPEAILKIVERKLKEMGPQRAPVQHQGVSRG